MDFEVGDWFCTDLFGRNAYVRITKINHKGHFVEFRDKSGSFRSLGSVEHLYENWTYVKNFELMDILYGEE